MYTEWEGRNKTVFAEDIVVYVENLKEFTKKKKLHRTGK